MPEIEEAICTRVFAIADAGEMEDPGYAAGVRAAVGTALLYGIEALESDDRLPPPVPTELLAQARLAASNAISLDRVLRRYFTGYALLSNFVVEEVERAGVSGRGRATRYLQMQTRVLEHLSDAIAEEYHRCTELQVAGSQERLERTVEALLADQMVDTSELAYDFSGWHLAAIAWGVDAENACRSLATRLDRQLLLLPRGDGTAWAWLGARRPVAVERVSETLGDLAVESSIAIGDPASGLAGWRRSHRQARAAMPIALREPRQLTRYVDVALLASIAQDDLLRTTLRMTYLAPFDDERDGGAVSRKTLRAYLQTGQNASSAAAILGVDRHTIANRLRQVEDRIGRPLSSCTTEMTLALRLEELGLSRRVEPATSAAGTSSTLAPPAVLSAPKR
jgi:hypothetical protein